MEERNGAMGRGPPEDKEDADAMERAFQLWWTRYEPTLESLSLTLEQRRIIKVRCRRDYLFNFATIAKGSWRGN